MKKESLELKTDECVSYFSELQNNDDHDDFDDVMVMILIIMMCIMIKNQTNTMTFWPKYTLKGTITKPSQTCHCGKIVKGGVTFRSAIILRKMRPS